MWTTTRRDVGASDTASERTARGGPRAARAHRATRIEPDPEKPRRSFVAAVRSNSRSPAYGPRSTTGTRTVRPRWRSLPLGPDGRVRFPAPNVRGVRLPPQPRGPPYRPGPYQETRA